MAASAMYQMHFERHDIEIWESIEKFHTDTEPQQRQQVYLRHQFSIIYNEVPGTKT